MQLTVRDVAKILSVSEKTVYRWLGEGSIPAYKVNDQYRFNRAELLEWATKNKVNVSTDIFNDPDDSTTPMPSLLEALTRGGIFYRVAGSDKEAILRATVACMHLPEEVDRDYLFKVLLAREELASTGIGEGIAIPHVRSPIVLHVQKPMVALAFLEQPVDFAAMDGQPVHALFTLISPTVRTHLHLLSRLAFVLREPGFKSLIQKQALREEILATLRQAEGGLKPAGQASAAP